MENFSHLPNAGVKGPDLPDNSVHLEILPKAENKKALQMGFFNPPKFLTFSLTTMLFPSHLQLFSLHPFPSSSCPAKAPTVRVESSAGGKSLIHSDAKLSSSALLADYLFSLGKQPVWDLVTIWVNDKHLISMQLLHRAILQKLSFETADNCCFLAHNRKVAVPSADGWQQAKHHTTNVISDLRIRWVFPYAQTK